MKRLFQILTVLLLSQAAQAQTKNNEKEPPKNVEVLCKLDTNTEVRYTIDLSEKKLYLTQLLNSGSTSGLPITISDREIRHEMRDTDGTLFVLIKIDRFTLSIRTYSVMLKDFTKTKDGWIDGQCEILKRLL